MLKELCSEKCFGLHKMLFRRSLGILVLRVIIGAVFFTHGLEKVQNIDGVIGFFGSIGFPAFFAYFVAWLELLGGIAIVIGISTRVAAWLLTIVMAVAILKLKVGGPFIGQGSAELELVLLGGTAALGFMGAGRFSLKRILWKTSCMCGCDGEESNDCNCKKGDCKDGACPNHAPAMKCDGCDTCKDGICTSHEAKK